MRLEKDWRLDAVNDTRDGGRVFDGEVLLEAADVVVVDPVRLQSGKVLAFPIPNATAMLLNSSFRMFKQAEVLLSPGLSYDKFRPVRPRWHVKCPAELSN
ncbi:MAG TPA: hypothetical protein PK947_00245 [Ottowia sp.]|nr:hypothetical protein [Ottowia sp.]